MTCKEQYIKDHPNLSEEAVEGVMRNMCPHDYGYLDEAYWCNGRNEDNCKKCWGREIQEEPIPALKVNWDKKQIHRNMGIPECYTDGTEKIAGDKQKQVAQLTVIGDKEPECVGSYTTHTGNIDKCFNCIYRSPFRFYFNANTEKLITLSEDEKYCLKWNKKIIGNVITCIHHDVDEESESKKFKEAGEALAKGMADSMTSVSEKGKAMAEQFNEAVAKMSKYAGVIRKSGSEPWTIKDNNEEVIKEPVDVTIGDIPLRDISSESLISFNESGAIGYGKIKDSGARREFETGAVRDIQEGKGRCDLLPLDVVDFLLTYSKISNSRIIHEVFTDIDLFMNTNNVNFLFNALNHSCIFKDPFTMFLEVSKHFEEGAKKYGEYNWQKGIPTHCYIDSAVRHYLKYLRGDKDEPHDRAFVWNILCCIWTCIHKPELNDYNPNNQPKSEFKKEV